MLWSLWLQGMIGMVKGQGPRPPWPSHFLKSRSSRSVAYETHAHMPFEFKELGWGDRLPLKVFVGPASIIATGHFNVTHWLSVLNQMSIPWMSSFLDCPLCVALAKDYTAVRMLTGQTALANRLSSHLDRSEMKWNGLQALLLPYTFHSGCLSL